MTEDTVVVEADEAQEEMNALDVLMGATSKRQVDEFKIQKRDGLPGDLILKLGSLNDRTFELLSEQAQRPIAANREQRRAGTPGGTEQDTPLFMRLVVSEGVVDPKLDNPDLLRAQGVKTAEALVRQLLLPGEIIKCAEYIMDLSGYHENAVTRVGN
jgi:hypothetical protein